MKRNLIVLFLIISTAVMFAGCFDEEEIAEEKIPYVKVQQGSPMGSDTESIYAGRVCGRYETNMSFQVGGQIIRRNVEVGSRVAAGDLLMTVDPKDILQQSNQSDAKVSSALAQLKLAESNLSRYSQLYKDEAIPASTLDQYQTNYEAAEAEYQEALAASKQGHNALSYTDLQASANGVISEINVEEGQVVAAGQTVLTLIQTDELEVEINVPENQLSAATVGKPVTVKFWALPNEVEGVIREVSPMADSTSRTYRVRISLFDVPSAIQLGMTASVTLTDNSVSNTASGVSLPLSAIYQTGEQAQVWVVTEENIVKLKNVKVTQFGDNEVVVSGVEPSELVVVAGVHKLREGQKVQTRTKEK